MAKTEKKAVDLFEAFNHPESTRFSVNSIRGKFNTELGYTGLDHSSGDIFEDILMKLQGTGGMKIWREMSENDDTVASVLYAIETLIRQLKWEVKPASDSSEDKKRAEFVNTCLHDMSESWPDTLTSILTFLSHGFSYHEIVYKRRMGPDKRNSNTRSKFNDGLIGWKKLPIRDQITITDGDWLIDDNGGIRGAWQWGPPRYSRIFIPIEKALLFRTTTRKNNPEGRSLLRGAYRAWWFKQNIENIEAIGIERDLAGLPVIKVPAKIMGQNASPEEKALYQHLKKIVRNIRNDEQSGIVIPGDHDENGKPYYNFELASSPGKKQFNTNDIIKRYQNAILQTLLADFLKLGQDKVGSYSLSSDKTNLFVMSLESIATQITSPMNDFAIPRLFKLNGWDQSRTPKLTHGDFERADITKLIDGIKKLTESGFNFVDSDTESKLRTDLDLPRKTQTEVK